MSWGRLGGVLEHLQPSWGRPGGVSGVLGRPGVIVSRLGASLGPSWGRLGPFLGPSWDVLEHLEDVLNLIFVAKGIQTEAFYLG